MTTFHCDKINGLKAGILSECIQNTIVVHLVVFEEYYCACDSQIVSHSVNLSPKFFLITI